MVAFRWAKSSATSSTPKFRWAKSTAQGTSAAPRFRWSNSAAQGFGNISLQPFADITVDGFDAVTITAFPSPGSASPTNYVWRQIVSAGDPVVSFTATGDHIVFTAPATMTSKTLVFGVTAYIGTTAATEVTANVITRVYLEWQTDGATWLPVSLPAIV